MLAWAAGIPLAMILIIAGVGKLVFGHGDITASQLAFIPPQFTALLPYIEITVGIMLIIGFAMKSSALIAGLLVTGYIVTNIIMLTMGIDECVTCFGEAVTLTPTLSLTLDVLMGILVATIFYCHRGKFADTKPWYLKSWDKQPVTQQQLYLQRLKRGMR